MAEAATDVEKDRPEEKKGGGKDIRMDYLGSVATETDKNSTLN